MATEKTVYVKDDDLAVWGEFKNLVEKRQVDADSVSDLVSQAMRAYLAQLREQERKEKLADVALHNLDGKMKRVELRSMARGGKRSERRDYVFTGTEVAYDDEFKQVAFLTPQHRIVMVDGRQDVFYVYDHLDDLDPNDWGDELVSDIAEKLCGERRPIELDI
jgi:hypothetical protein